MEEAGYYAAIAVLIAFGLLAGNRWARSMGHAVLLGLATVVGVAMTGKLNSLMAAFTAK